MLERAKRLHAKNLHRVFASFSPEELGSLDALLDKLRMADLSE